MTRTKQLILLHLRSCCLSPVYFFVCLFSICKIYQLFKLNTKGCFNFIFILLKMHNIKFTILIIFKFDSVKYIHTTVQPSPGLFSSCKTKTLCSVNNSYPITMAYWYIYNDIEQSLSNYAEWKKWNKMSIYCMI